MQISFWSGSIHQHDATVHHITASGKALTAIWRDVSWILARGRGMMTPFCPSSSRQRAGALCADKKLNSV